MIFSFFKNKSVDIQNSKKSNDNKSYLFGTIDIDIEIEIGVAPFPLITDLFL